MKSMPEERSNGYRSGYASVNGLNMYYEIHGAGRPLVLLHGSLTTIDTSFGNFIPFLATARQVIAVEQQGHGHTADVDRPLTYEQMAEDTTELLRQLKIEKADFFGYSMGSAIAMQIAIKHSDLVRKLVVVSPSYNNDGLYPEVLEGEDKMKPEDLDGSEWQKDYMRIAPNPEHWHILIAKEQQLTREFKGWTPDEIQSIKTPTFIIIGDSDIVLPEHVIEIFKLLGGGVAGDLAGLPRSRLAILPGTTHITLVGRADWLLPMIEEFLNAPVSEGND